MNNNTDTHYNNYLIILVVKVMITVIVRIIKNKYIESNYKLVRDSDRKKY